MVTYAVVEIAGRQYTVEPNKPFEVDYLGEVESFTCEKVLLTSENNKLTVGNPYLKDTLVFDVVANIKKPKIRVAKYSAKANSRRVRGSRALKTKLQLHTNREKA